MNDQHALAKFRAQLRGYDEGARLKIAAMQEVKETLGFLKLSQREFVADAKKLGFAFPTFQAFNSWISCLHMPTPENVDMLIEVLDMMLRARGVEGEPWHAPLRESSHLHQHYLVQFRRDVQNLEQARELLDATLAWLDLIETPPANGILSGAFIPITREHGIQCLEIIRDVHFLAAETAKPTRMVEHELLAAKAAIALAHQLNVIGEYSKGLEAADEGSYVLAEILCKHPAWRTVSVDAHSNSAGEPITLQDYQIMGLTRKAFALHALNQLAGSATARKDYQNMAQRTLAHAFEQVANLPDDSFLMTGLWRTRAIFALDNATTHCELCAGVDHAATAYGQIPQTRATRMTRVQAYTTLLVQAEALARTGDLQIAADLLAEAEQIEQELGERENLKIAPAHQIIRWRTLAAYWLTHAQNERVGTPLRQEYSKRWAAAADTGMHLAQQTGFFDLGRRQRLLIAQVAPEFRRFLVAGSAAA